MALGAGCFLVFGTTLFLVCLRGGTVPRSSLLPEPVGEVTAPALAKPAREGTPREPLPDDKPEAVPLEPRDALVEIEPPPAVERPLAPAATALMEQNPVLPATPAAMQDDGIKFIAGPLILPSAADQPKYRVHTRPALQNADVKPVRLAVTPAQFDDMGRLLTELGEGYPCTPITEADLGDLKKLTGFDVVFLTCASSRTYDLRAISALRRYVELGGTLYASDLRFDLVARAFPEKIVRRPIPSGIPQSVRASVLDPGLRQLLGPGIVLDFNSPGWRPAAFDSGKTKVYIQGPYRSDRGPVLVAPLLVKFPCKKGTVIFTSFHNAAQNNDVQKRLLQYLVFTAINAQTETMAHKAMLLGGFAPKETRNLTIGTEPANVQLRYTLTKPRDIQFAVGFGAQAANLRLEIESPTGAKIQHTGATTFILELPEAPAGEWRCTVTAAAAPFANYPFTWIVGEATRP
jgi:hypothetical protein